MRNFAKYPIKWKECIKVVTHKISEHCRGILLYILMWLNLYYMHNEVYISRNSYAWSDGYTPFFFMCYDILCVLFFFEIIMLGKRKIAFSVSYLLEAFRWRDLLIAFNIFGAIILIRKLPNQISWHAPLHIIYTFLIVTTIYVYTATRHDQVSLRSYTELRQWRWQTLQFKEHLGSAVYNPDATIFNYGIVEAQIVFGFLTGYSVKKLDDVELTEIRNFIDARYSEIEAFDDSFNNYGSPDIVMIVLESGMSCAIDECIDDSILRVLKDSIIALPSLLEKKGYSTCITIPNNENFWHQKELNTKYGFSNFFALGTEENGNWCMDDEIFKNAMQEQKQLKQPFFHVEVF